MTSVGMSLQGSNAVVDREVVVLLVGFVAAGSEVDVVAKPEILLEHPPRVIAKTRAIAARSIALLAAAGPKAMGVAPIHRLVPILESHE
ncbi:Uncharacterised protein [Mycobacteroides abscessus subsp. abscessus]|nr:Uncharacterised protein [Mycobacteroides abscessus subsp. abscessus]SHP70763.1 Uncharacterised protein [Mycobacteroides abscessus subsp. abscessus]SHR11299.1 Uncharacterised protein [Mycobacteroides abscessus subsp. abscessus]SHT14602.1 Uncharacterised protein [Mycobacteroides abscessus subsp. abscessus]SHT76113.1 Uncharacterised protein [Mycobacteroides abscessus subsp. abscessus]